MKVTVTKYLNVRVGKPSVNAPCYQYLAPGSEIEVDGKLYKGDKYKDIDTWVKDEAGNYYWSGGIVLESEPAKSTIITDSYDAFLAAFEKGDTEVGVALLDSGINEEHPFLSELIDLNKSLLPDIQMQGISSHGTKVAGVLASTDPAVKRNRSRILSFRVADSRNSVNGKAVEKALIEIRDTLASKVDVVNMSINILSEYVDILQPIINSLADQGIIVVVAAGENNNVNNTALLQRVIRVASFDEYKINELYSNSFLNKSISTYSLNGNSLDDSIGEDSGYCAAVSALLARWISSKRIAKNKTRILNAETFLKGISQSIKTNIVIKPFKLYI
jgi:subtilisin family serine protease